MEIRKANMEIRKNNIEIRKNWNKLSFKKLGAIFCLFLFGIVTFISGNLSQVNAATSSTVLPIAKGGTGVNSLSSGQALIGNGANSLQTKPIDTSPQSNSNNLITSGGVKSVSNNADLAKGNDNIYFVNTTNNDQEQVVYLIGPIASLSAASPEYTNFSAQVTLLRIGGKTSTAINSNYYVTMTSAYLTSLTSASINLLGKSGFNRTLSTVSFTYNSKEYLGLQTSKHSTSSFIIKGYCSTSLNCVSNSGLCTGRMFTPSEISNIKAM
ncbi:MAG: hypothetical protein LBT99_04210 [Bifidobacteriaceae bacterium]|nr:hypothetical protein [Bifidobacteriaceae bacterium]